ncbi:MAG: glycosyltransferase family 4 protein [Chloroflexota bacterium]
MRVIHVAPTAFGRDGLFGGGERYPYELARALAQHVSCELVTFGPDAGIRRDGPLTIRVVRPLTYLDGHPARAIAPALAGVIRDADIVHAHHMRAPSSVVAGLTARARGIATVVTDHGLQGSDWGGLIPRLFDRFLVVSRYSGAQLRAPRRRTRVVYGGANTVRHRPDPELPRAGVLFVGRLTPHKGVDVLIRALPPGARLTVVGSEGHDPRLPERDYPKLLRTLAADRRVKFLGAIDDDELAGRYRTASVVVVPSVERTCYGRRIAVSELLGLVALEAMASGTPVIASRVGGLPEIVEDGVTGFVVPPGDVGSLRQRISNVLDDPAMAAELGSNARERVVTELSWDRCAERCLAAYRELLDSDQRS